MRRILVTASLAVAIEMRYVPSVREDGAVEKREAGTGNAKTEGKEP